MVTRTVSAEEFSIAFESRDANHTFGGSLLEEGSQIPFYVP
jgi:hypothetical protein